MTRSPYWLGLAATTLPALLGLAACDSNSPAGPPRVSIGPAIAFGIWTPGPNDTCTQAIHDSYSVVGPDNKTYPTWHPPIDPVTGCTFGHEHGRDPRGSHLYHEVGPIPFGYANEQLETWDPLNPRREDHFGHKVEWENDVRLNFGSDAASSLFDIRCDVLAKLHQGTHSKDAFTNNLHELVYHVECSDGTEMHLTLLTAIGDPGQFIRSCDGTAVSVGSATPANSPSGGGERIIPDRSCVLQSILVPVGQSSDLGVLRESWQTSVGIRTTGGRGLAFINPYFQVRFPSRYYDPAIAPTVGRPVDLCYEVTPGGNRAQSGTCNTMTANGTITGITFDDPRSPFNGADRTMDVNENQVTNADGPKVWFTDPFGRNARVDSFPGAVRQWIARIDNTRGGLGTSGPSVRRNYGGASVHPPN
jgi:hypothetical protein